MKASVNRQSIALLSQDERSGKDLILKVWLMSATWSILRTELPVFHYLHLLVDC